jgi:hypothetical protein
VQLSIAAAGGLSLLLRLLRSRNGAIDVGPATEATAAVLQQLQLGHEQVVAIASVGGMGELLSIIQKVRRTVGAAFRRNYQFIIFLIPLRPFQNTPLFEGCLHATILLQFTHAVSVSFAPAKLKRGLEEFAAIQDFSVTLAYCTLGQHVLMLCLGCPVSLLNIRS